MLETLDDPTIHRMTLEESEGKWTQWPNIEISSQEMIGIDRYLTKLKWDELNYCKYAAILYELNSELKPGPDNMKFLHALLIKARNRGDGYNFAEIASTLEIFGEQFTLKKDDVSLMQADIIGLKNAGDRYGSLKLCANLKKFGEKFEFNPADVAVIQNYTSILRGQGNMPLLLSVYRRMYELELNIQIPPNEVEDIVEYFNQLRTREDAAEFIPDIAEMASDLKYFSQLPKNTSHIIEKPSMPVEREF